jgi:hypothetical protein
MYIHGEHPHISIEDRVFVETLGGDLTVKVENNTDSGRGIYSEPVDNKDQTLDDAEVHYAIVGNLILLKVLPYQEKTWRHLVFNERTRQAHRIDSIAESCVLLPDDHGILFPHGYVLQTGEVRRFETGLPPMRFEKRIACREWRGHAVCLLASRKRQRTCCSATISSRRASPRRSPATASAFPHGRIDALRWRCRAA